MAELTDALVNACLLGRGLTALVLRDEIQHGDRRDLHLSLVWLVGEIIRAAGLEPGEPVSFAEHPMPLPGSEDLESLLPALVAAVQNRDTEGVSLLLRDADVKELRTLHSLLVDAVVKLRGQGR